MSLFLYCYGANNVQNSVPWWRYVLCWDLSTTVYRVQAKHFNIQGVWTFYDFLGRSARVSGHLNISGASCDAVTDASTCLLRFVHPETKRFSGTWLGVFQHQSYKRHITCIRLWQTHGTSTKLGSYEGSPKPTRYASGSGTVNEVRMPVSNAVLSSPYRCTLPYRYSSLIPHWSESIKKKRAELDRVLT
jgi:hypothetical protein